MSALRGGFRATVHSATGSGKPRPVSPGRRIVGNVITVVLLIAAAALLLKRFGLLR